MNKTAAALALIICVAVATTAVIYVVKLQQPAQEADEFSTIDDLLGELDDFLNFENQEFDYDLGEITGDWG